MTGQIGTAPLFADGLGTTIAGFGGGSGTTTYGRTSADGHRKVTSTAAYWCAAAFADLAWRVPAPSSTPSPPACSTATLLYGMIGMVGIRIWVENRSTSTKPVNVMVAAITMIIAVGRFEFAASMASPSTASPSAPSSSSSPTTA